MQTILTEWSEQIQWFVVRAKRFREPLAAANIRALGLEAYLPMAANEASPDTICQTDRKPLFPTYFFARFAPHPSLEAVDSCHGVHQVLRSGNAPIPVDDAVIREIQDRADEPGLIRLQPRDWTPGQRICVQAGPFEGMLGRVEQELDDHKRVAIFLETLWQARVLIDKRWFEAVAA